MGGVQSRTSPRVGSSGRSVGSSRASSFEPGAEFQWQHDVTVYPGTPLVTVFDDHLLPESQPRASIVATWSVARSSCSSSIATTHAATRRRPVHPGRDASTPSSWATSNHCRAATSSSAGAHQPRFSEYTASGRMLLDAVLPGPDITYRATIEPWIGLPLYPPSGAARRTNQRTTVYASWNGATQVAAWRVLAESSNGALMPLATASKIGFETAIAVPGSYRVFRVQALDPRGQILGVSAPFVTTGRASSGLHGAGGH